MTAVKIDLPVAVTGAIEQRVAALGTTLGQWVSLVITETVADLPEEGDGADAWTMR